ncbi:chitin synthase [Histoplasma capsulatum]|uniref:Chitin synthase n=1 Tax=Ajellomyces capsulatus TaxID=5037 RepID=A0A8A1MJ51_AJECA|nr:chitin synthase [Histoplasma capsulatum]
MPAASFSQRSVLVTVVKILCKGRAWQLCLGVLWGELVPSHQLLASLAKPHREITALAQREMTENTIPNTTIKILVYSLGKWILNLVTRKRSRRKKFPCLGVCGQASFGR